MKISKILICVALFIQMALVLTTCKPRFPSGVWKSDYPNIIVFMDRVYEPPIDMLITHRISYVGTYITSVKKTRLFILRSATPHFNIYKVEFRDDGTVRRGEQLSSGTWRVIRGELHYRIVDFPAFGLEMGDTIIFRRITDYEPPNFDEWFPPVE